MKHELSYLEKKVLLTLEKLKVASPETIMKEGKFKELVEVMNASSWLLSKGLVSIEETFTTYYSLDKDGKKFIEVDTPERRALKLLSNGDLKLQDLSKSGFFTGNEVQIAIGWLKKKGWANISKKDNETIISMTEKGLEAYNKKDIDELLLEKLSKEELSENDLNDDEKNALLLLKSRQRVIRSRDVVSRKISLTKAGEDLLSEGIELREEIAQLTPELIQSGKWKEVDIRRYDPSTFAPSIYGGKPHPLRQIVDEVRAIFIQMGFKEIEEDFVQSSFWNLDALFVPQDHPAREMQDTFYTENPSKILLQGEEKKGIVGKVKDVHENGGNTGSEGWKYNWKLSEAERALIRTHTTVNTIRYLAKNPKPPIKVFTVGKVFRNEALDYKHLPEFIQVEGIVMEEGASLGMLIGTLTEFYRKMGFEKVDIRPSFFPYTEPSLEVFVNWDGKWMELGGAGIFRPEVTLPFGVNYPVLAWGQGLERLAMVRLGIKDMRELYLPNIDNLRKTPLSKPWGMRKGF